MKEGDSNAMASLNFKPETSIKATRLERGDKYDHSVVHLLSTLPSEAFLVEKKGGSWIVTTGLVSPVVIVKAKAEKPKKKKK